MLALFKKAEKFLLIYCKEKSKKKRRQTNNVYTGNTAFQSVENLLKENLKKAFQKLQK